MPTHPDCSSCCALQRCHWCLVHTGDSAITGSWSDYTIFACRAHAKMFTKSLERRPKPGEVGPMYPLSVEDESFVVTPLTLLQ